MSSHIRPEIVTMSQFANTTRCPVCGKELKIKEIRDANGKLIGAERYCEDNTHCYRTSMKYDENDGIVCSNSKHLCVGGQEIPFSEYERWFETVATEVFNADNANMRITDLKNHLTQMGLPNWFADAHSIMLSLGGI